MAKVNNDLSGSCHNTIKRGHDIEANSKSLWENTSGNLLINILPVNY
ncbi:MAG: hypothetical protein JXA68_00005 [Ignavibacteriales bacterium]|nr:hypothetical protein [Ignavibacteriales bacterium]